MLHHCSALENFPVLLFHYTSITILELLLNPSKLKLYLKNQAQSSVLRKYANLHICLHKNGF